MRLQRTGGIFWVMILTVLISTAACTAPKVTKPKIEYKTHTELKTAQPACMKEIEDLREARVITQNLVQEALFCYRSVWKYWEREYKILDARLDAMNRE